MSERNSIKHSGMVFGLLSQRVCRLVLFAAANMFLSVLLWDLHSCGFLRAASRQSGGRLFTDSFVPMYRAMQAWQEGAGIYERIFFEQQTKFQYPPTALLVLLPFRGMSELHVNLLFGQHVNMCFFFATVAVFVLLARRLFISDDEPRLDRVAKYGGAIVLLLCYYPLGKAHTLGQIQTWINCFVMLSLLLWWARKESATGLLLGLCTLIKPAFGILLLWGLLRRKWRFAGAMFSTVVAGGLVALPIFGLREFLRYGDVLSFIGRRGESFFPNQSFNGLMHRLLQNGNNLDWVSDGFPPYHPAVHSVTLIAGVLLLGSALALPLVRRKATGSSLDLCIMLLSLTMASPIAWEHHYGYSVAVYALALYWILGTRERHRNTACAILVVSYLMGGHWWRFVDPLVAATPFNFLQSYLLFAGLMLLGVLWYLCLTRRMRTLPAAVCFAGGDE